MSDRPVDSSDPSSTHAAVPDAITHALEALTLAPTIDDAWRDAEDAVRDTQRPEEVADAMARIVEALSDSDAIVRWGTRAVRFVDEWFEEPSRAIRLLDRVLAADPFADWALERLVIAYTKTSRWNELLATLARTIAATTDSTRKQSLLEESVAVARDFAHDDARAIDALKQLVELDADNGSFAAALERLLSENQRHADLVELWSSRLDRVDPAQARVLRVRVACARFDGLHDAEGALRESVALLGQDDGPPELLALFERIGHDGRSANESRRRALTLLRDHFASIGAESDRERILMTLATCTAGAERAGVHRDLAERFAKTDRPIDAMDQLGALITLEPGEQEARQRLRTLAFDHSAHAHHAAILVRSADSLGESSLAADRLAEAAHIILEREHDPEAARPLFLRAFAAAATDPAMAVPIGRDALELLPTDRYAATRLSVLEQVGALAIDRNAWGEAARVAESIGDPDRAIANWRHRLDRDARDTEALDATIALFEQTARWNELAIALRARVEAAKPVSVTTEPVAEKSKTKKATTSRSRKKKSAEETVGSTAPAIDPRVRSDLVTLARLQLERLDDASASERTWREIVSSFGPTDDTDDALADIARLRGDRDAQQAALDAGLARATTPTRRALLLARVGRVHEESDDAERAATFFRDALELDPTCGAARDDLRSLLDRGRVAPGSVHALVAAFAATREPHRTLEILEHRLAAASSATERAAILLESAAIHEQRAEPDEALVLLRRAFEQSPADAEIEARILSHARTRNAWQAAIDAYLRAAEAATDASLIARLHVRAAVAMESANDIERARAMFDRVLADHPGDLDAAAGSVRTAGKLDRWDDAMRVAVTAAVALQELPGSLVETLEHAARESGAWEAAARSLANAIATGAASGDLAARLEHLVARWHRDELHDTRAAITSLERAIAHTPNLDAVRALVDARRATPDRALFDTLTLLARIDPGDPSVSLEAARTAIDTLASRDLARPHLSAFIDALVARLRETPATALVASDATWVLDHAVDHDLAVSDDQAARTLLATTESLPPTETGRWIRRHAAALAETRLADPAFAIGLFGSLHRDAPDDRDTVASLAALYERTNDPARWRDMLERLLALLPTVDERIAVRLRLADAYDALGERAAAMATLRASLDDRPGEPASLEALGRRLTDDTRYGDHAALLVEQAMRLEGPQPERAIELWQRAADVREDRLGDLEAALEAHARAVALAPGVSSLDAIARLHVARGDHAAAARALDAVLSLAATDRVPEFSVRLARSLNATRHHDAAIAVLTRALATHPGATEARTLLVEHYRADQAWDALASTLAAGVDHAADARERTRLLREAAAIHLDRRLDAMAAIPLLERAVAEVPSEASHRVALAGALRSAGQLDEAERVLDALLQDYGRRRPTERAMVHLELARIAQQHGQLSVALEQLETASSMDMVHTGILRLLGDLARDDGQLDRAERAYRTLLMIVRRHDPNRDDGTSPQTIGPAEVMLELHWLAEQRDPQRRSRELLEGAFELAAASVAESRRMERTLRSRAAHDLLIRALRARLGRAKDPESGADALSDLADALDLIPGAEQEALDARLQALANAPRAAVLHDKMLAVAKRSQRLGPYVDMLGELAARARDDGETDLAVDVSARLADVEIQHLGRIDRGIEALRRAEALGGTNPRISFALADAHGRLGDDAARLDVLRRLADAAPAAVEATHRAEALYRIADLQLGRAELRDEGVRTLITALQRDPQPTRAAALLGTAAVGAPHDVPLLALYLRVARESRDERLLLDALERNAAIDESPDGMVREAALLAVRIAPERAEALLALAAERAREGHGDLAAAEWALELLYARARERGDANAASKWLDEEISIALRNEADDARLHALGARARSNAMDLPQAARVYEALHARARTDHAAWGPLLETYRAMGDLEGVERTIKTVEDHVWDDAQRNRLRIERARILLDHSDRVGEALSALRYVLGDEPDHPEASELLREALRRSGRADEYVALLRQQLDRAWKALERDRILSLSRELAPLVEADDPATAIEIYRTASECAPDDADLIERLLRLYPADAIDPRRADALERKLALASNADAPNVALELGTLRRALNDPNNAARALETGLRAAPGHAALTEQLEAIYRAESSWRELAALFERDAESRESPRQAVTRLREAATLRRERLRDVPGAAATLKRARALTPADLDLLAEYTDALRDAGDPATAVVEIGTAIARGIPDPQVHAGLLVRRAAMQSAAGRDDAALADLEKAFALAPDAAGDPLCALLESRRTAAAARGDDATVGAIAVQLAQVLVRRGDSSGAAAALDRRLATSPRDVGALRALVRIHAGAERWREAAAAATQRIAVESGAGVVEAAVELADACEKLGRPAEARTGLEAALRTHPRDEVIRSRLSALYDAAGDHRGVATLSLAAVDGARDDAERFKLLVRAGDTLLRAAKDPAAALEPLERAWKLKPTDLEAAVLLADALRALRRGTESEGVLRQAVDAAKGRRSRDLGQVQLRLAHMARDTGDGRGAMTWLVSALESDFQNAQIASDLADAAMALGEDETALRALRAIALMKNPAPMSRAIAFSRQGIIAGKQGDKKKAAFFARKALLEDPQLVEAQELLKRSE